MRDMIQNHLMQLLALTTMEEPVSFDADSLRAEKEKVLSAVRLPGDLAAGTRVVVDPVLTCAARGLEACEACARGETNRCSRITVGDISSGLQTGFCHDTGGGWSQQLSVHRSQLHVVPEGYSDEQALLAEPVACAVHTARRAAIKPGDRVLVSAPGRSGCWPRWPCASSPTPARS